MFIYPETWCAPGVVSHIPESFTYVKFPSVNTPDAVVTTGRMFGVVVTEESKLGRGPIVLAVVAVAGDPPFTPLSSSETSSSWLEV